MLPFRWLSPALSVLLDAGSKSLSIPYSFCDPAFAAGGTREPVIGFRGVTPMCRLTSVTGSFLAHLVAAHLQSEGIDVQLRGALDGPYGLTMGDLARVDVFVPADQLDDAEMVMLATAVDEALAAPSEWGGPGARR